MSLNPSLDSNHKPSVLQGEEFNFTIKKVQFAAESFGGYPGLGGNWYAKSGTLYLSEYRLVYVLDKRNRPLKSFEFPLTLVTQEEYKKPRFGKTYLTGVVKNVPNGGVKKPTKFKLTFLDKKKQDPEDFSFEFLDRVENIRELRKKLPKEKQKKLVLMPVTKKKKKHKITQEEQEQITYQNEVRQFQNNQQRIQSQTNEQNQQSFYPSLEITNEETAFVIPNTENVIIVKNQNQQTNLSNNQNSIMNQNQNRNQIQNQNQNLMQNQNQIQMQSQIQNINRNQNINKTQNQNQNQNQKNVVLIESDTESDVELELLPQKQKKEKKKKKKKKTRNRKMVGLN
ncbi:ww domain binding protein [Anaeramoeba flamelloides]|uniref:Ww domain binding protein n=1 Tax=Anaeramoeba flamelloides TaxID=1746091 RepID=A0ABQ8YHK2_9EUKA|nr:ww domain binding protein [Anaeramoeba flamelloides]